MTTWTLDVQDGTGETVPLNRWQAVAGGADALTCAVCCQPTAEGWAVFLGAGRLTLYCDDCTADTFLAPED